MWLGVLAGLGSGNASWDSLISEQSGVSLS